MSLLAPNSPKGLDKKFEHDGSSFQIELTRKKIYNGLTNKFDRITFNESDTIQNFSKNLDELFIRFEQTSIKSKQELDDFLRLLEDIYKYILANKDKLLESHSGIVAGIKITFNDIYQTFLKRIDFFSFLSAGEINSLFKKTEENYKKGYYLFVPPDTKELPKEINPIKYRKTIKTDASIFTNQSNFEQVYDGLSEMCTNLIFRTEEINNLSVYEINELIFCLDDIEKLLLQAININGVKNIVNNNIKTKIYRLSNYYLSGALRKVKHILLLKEAPEKINTFFDKITTFGTSENIKNTYKNHEVFGEFIDMHRKFVGYSYTIENSINKLNPKDVEKLLNTIRQLKLILENMVEIKETDSSIWRKVVYNSSSALKNIENLLNRFSILVSSPQ